jgi:hypothetical protein
MKITIWHKPSGAAIECDTVDAREMLARAPELYTSVNPNAPAAEPIVPPNVSEVESEYKREPVSGNPSGAPRVQTIVRNATGAPRLGSPTPDDHFVRRKRPDERGGI